MSNSCLHLFTIQELKEKRYCSIQKFVGQVCSIDPYVLKCHPELVSEYYKMGDNKTSLQDSEHSVIVAAIFFQRFRMTVKFCRISKSDLRSNY